MSWCIYDLETDGLLDDVSKVLCMVLRDDDGNVYQYADGDKCNQDVDRTKLHGSVTSGIEHLAQFDIRAGHNIQGYDDQVLSKLFGWQAPETQLCRDTLILSRLIWPDLRERDFSRLAKDPDFPKKDIGSHGLSAWGQRLGILKGDVDVKGLTELSQTVLDYCVQDTAVNAALWSMQCDRLPEVLS